MLDWLFAIVAFFYVLAIFLFLELWLPLKKPPRRVTDRRAGAASDSQKCGNA
jgi:hypothetical protein